MFLILRHSIKSQAEGTDKARQVTKLAWLVIAGIATLCLIAAVLHVMRPDIDPTRFTVSNYALGPYGLLMTAAFFVFAMSLLALALGLSRTINSQRKTRAGVFLLKVACLGMIVAGIFPVDPNVVQFPRTTIGTIHFLAAMIAFLCIACATVVISLALKKDERWQVFQGLSFRLSLLVMTALFLFIILMFTTWRGLGQRIYLATNLLWMLLTAVQLRLIGSITVQPREEITHEKAVAQNGGTILFTGRRMIMKHTIVRITLFVLELLAALGTIAGGLALLAGVIRFPLEQLQGTPFSDYTLPGLILAIVVGGSSLIGAATSFLHRELAVLFSAAAGLILAGWIIGEIILLGPFALAWQIPFLGWGLVIFVLASYLWMTEYREQHFPSRPVSHA